MTVQIDSCRLLISRYETGWHGTFGVMVLEGIFSGKFHTLEPWLYDGQHPAIPSGEYVARRHVSPKFGPCWMIQNVPGRDHILFHHGNVWRRKENKNDNDWIYETTGCILLGSDVGFPYDLPGIVNSRVSRKKFEDLTSPFSTLQVIIENNITDPKK